MTSCYELTAEVERDTPKAHAAAAAAAAAAATADGRAALGAQLRAECLHLRGDIGEIWARYRRDMGEI